jgi:hypothetical protein
MRTATWADGVFEAMPPSYDDELSDDDIAGITDPAAGGEDGAMRKRQRDPAKADRSTSALAGAVGELIELGTKDRPPLFGGVPEGSSVIAIKTTLGIAPAHPHEAPDGCLVVALRQVRVKEVATGAEEQVWVGRLLAPARVWSVGQLQPAQAVLWPQERATKQVMVALMQLQLLREMVRRASSIDTIARDLADAANRAGQALHGQLDRRLLAARAAVSMTLHDGVLTYPWTKGRSLLLEVFRGVAHRLRESEDGRFLAAKMAERAYAIAQRLGVHSATPVHPRRPAERWAPPPSAADAVKKEKGLLDVLPPNTVARLQAMRAGEQALMDMGVAVMQTPTDAEARVRRLSGLAQRMEALAKGDPIAEDVREARSVTALLAAVSEADKHGAGASLGGGASLPSAASSSAPAAAAGVPKKPASVPHSIVWAPPEQRARLQRLAAELRRMVKAAESVAALLFNTPWAQSRDFVSVVHEGGAGQLTLRGDGVRGRNDPSGCGAMLSFVKEPAPQRENAGTALRGGRAKRGAAQTGKDYRKLKVPVLDAMLRSRGVPDSEIAKLQRWAKTRALKDIDTLTEQGGSVIGGLADLGAAAAPRHEGSTTAQRLGQKRMQSASIMAKQRQWLAKKSRSRGHGSSRRRGRGTVEDEDDDDDDSDSAGDSDASDVSDVEEAEGEGISPDSRSGAAAPPASIRLSDEWSRSSAAGTAAGAGPSSSSSSSSASFALSSSGQLKARAPHRQTTTQRQSYCSSPWRTPRVLVLARLLQSPRTCRGASTRGSWRCCAPASPSPGWTRWTSPPGWCGRAHGGSRCASWAGPRRQCSARRPS